MKLKKDWTLAHFLYYLFVIGYILSGIAIVILVIGSLAGAPVGASIEVEIANPNHFEQLEKMGIYVSNNLKGNLDVLEMKQLSGLTTFLFYFWEVFPYIITFITTYFLSRICKAVKNENPFNKKSITYFYIVGWTFIISSIVYLLFSFYANSVFEGLDLPSGVEIIWSYSMGEVPVTLGIFMILLGYIFKEGHRLVEEQKLTV